MAVQAAFGCFAGTLTTLLNRLEGFDWTAQPSHVAGAMTATPTWSATIECESGHCKFITVSTASNTAAQSLPYTAAMTTSQGGNMLCVHTAGCDLKQCAAGIKSLQPFFQGVGQTSAVAPAISTSKAKRENPRADTRANEHTHVQKQSSTRHPPNLDRSTHPCCYNRSSSVNTTGTHQMPSGQHSQPGRGYRSTQSWGNCSVQPSWLPQTVHALHVLHVSHVSDTYVQSKSLAMHGIR